MFGRNLTAHNKLMCSSAFGYAQIPQAKLTYPLGHYPKFRILYYQGGAMRDKRNLNYGGNLNINSLSYKNGPDFSNFYLGFFAKRPIVEKETSTINAGVNFDLMFFDKDYIDATGTGISLFVSGKDTKGFEFMTKKFSGTHLFSWGGMLTFSNADKQSQTLMNGGASYGIPIGEKLTTTLDMFGTFILASSYDGHDLDIDDPFMLNSGVYCSYLLSSLFNLNFGLKKVFFVEDFSSTELTLGANYRF